MTTISWISKSRSECWWPMGRRTLMIIRWCIVWMKDVLGMKLSKVASLTLVSGRTMQRYMDRFWVSWNVSPFIQENGAARLLSECDEGVLVQTTLNKPESCLKELQQSREWTNGVYIDSSTILLNISKVGLQATENKIYIFPKVEVKRLDCSTWLK